MDFRNIKISKDIKFFSDKILKTYPNLIDNYNINKPCIFFGCYSEEDFTHIANHKSYGLIIWGGSDSMNQNFLSKVKNLDENKFFSIAQSKWIQDDLNRKSLRNAFRPWYCLNKSNFKPVPKGNKIYIYMPGEIYTQKRYGLDIFNEIKSSIPSYEFIIGDGNIPYSEIFNAYKQCFIGLRLGKHDGLGSTVQELGLMGIKTVHNGQSPSALNYNSVNDILNKIEEESKLIGSVDFELAKEVNYFLTIEDEFFDIKTWFN